MKKKAKKPEKEPNLERWLVSYADFITLLFAVFTTLYAMSAVNKRKVEQVRRSIRSSFGYSIASAPSMNIIESTVINPIPEVPNMPAASAALPYASASDLSRIRGQLQQQLSASIRQDVRITLNKRGLRISLLEAGFFASGSAKLQPDALPALDRIASALAGYANNIRVEGYTDNVPIHTAAFPSNWELSTARATNIVHYLINHHHFRGARLSAIGYGEYHPIASNRTAAGRKLNRRVDILMLSQKDKRPKPLQNLGQASPGSPRSQWPKRPL